MMLSKLKPGSLFTIENRKMIYLLLDQNHLNQSGLRTQLVKNMSAFSVKLLGYFVLQMEPGSSTTAVILRDHETNLIESDFYYEDMCMQRRFNNRNTLLRHTAHEFLTCSIIDIPPVTFFLLGNHVWFKTGFYEINKHGDMHCWAIDKAGAGFPLTSNILGIPLTTEFFKNNKLLDVIP